MALRAEPSSADAFLAVHVGDGPDGVRDGLAVGIEQVELRHGRERLAILGAEGFQAELTAFGGLRESHLLGGRSRCERAGVDRRHALPASGRLTGLSS